jgi:hypothetical protein
MTQVNKTRQWERHWHTNTHCEKKIKKKRTAKESRCKNTGLCKHYQLTFSTLEAVESRAVIELEKNQWHCWKEDATCLL